MDLNNVISYKDFLNEKNQYAVFVDGEQHGRDGDYKIGRRDFEEAISDSEPGTKVELFKVEDAQGSKVKELKKSEIVTKKEIKEATIKDIKQTIEQQLLDLFYKLNGSSVIFQKEGSKPKKITSLKEGDIEIGEPFELKFYVSPMDFAHGVQISKEYKDSLKFNKEFNEGVSQKKPYLLIISDIRTEKGESAFFEDIEKVKKKFNKEEKLTKAEEDLIYLLKKAENINSIGTEDDKFERKADFTLIYTIKLVNNPNFGGTVVDTDDDDDDDSSGLSDDFFGTSNKKRVEDDEDDFIPDNIEPTGDYKDDLADLTFDSEEDDLPY
jgi:hypothetical protein